MKLLEIAKNWEVFDNFNIFQKSEKMTANGGFSTLKILNALSDQLFFVLIFLVDL
jgi:hypothetical protein